MSKSKFIHTLSESKNIFASEQKAIILSAVKYVAFLLRHPEVRTGPMMVTVNTYSIFTRYQSSFNENAPLGLMHDLLEDLFEFIKNRAFRK